MKVPISTPNCSLYLELAIIPINYEIMYRKLVFLHKILTNPSPNIITTIYNQQASSKYPNWCNEAIEIRTFLKLRQSDHEIAELSKNQWKNTKSYKKRKF